MSVGRLLRGLEAALAWRSWRLWVIAVVLGLAVIFSWPSFAQVHPVLRRNWKVYWGAVVEKKVQKPLADMGRLFPPESNAAKRTFRFFVPVLARASGTGAAGAFFINRVFGCLFLWLALGCLEKCAGGRLEAALALPLLACVYAGTAGFKDIIGWFDATALALMMAAMTVRPAWVCAAALLCAGFTDERALLAAPLVTLFRLDTRPGTGGSAVAETAPALSRWRPTAVEAGALLGATAAYGLVRAGLTLGLGLATPVLGLSVLRSATPTHLLLGLWSGWEGAWLVFGTGTLVLLHKPSDWKALFLVLYFSAFCASCLLVVDITRSLAYGFPALFAMLRLLGRRLGVRERRRLLVVAALISLVTPNTFVWHYRDTEDTLPKHFGAPAETGP